MDAKLRDEENRRQRNLAAKGRGDMSKRAGSKDRKSKAVPAPEANAELPDNLQRRRVAATYFAHQNPSTKSKSEKFPPPHEDGALGFLIEPPKLPMENSGHSFVQVPGHAAATNPSSQSGLMGPRRKRTSGGEDVRMAPGRSVSRAAKSFSASVFASGQSGDLSHLPTMIANKDSVTKDPSKEKSSNRDGLCVDAGKNSSRRFGQLEMAQFSGSFRRMTGPVKDGRPPLRSAV